MHQCLIDSLNITADVCCYSIFHMQTETAKPSLVKRIATAADEASAEAATKLLSAPPSGCLYKLKSKDQPGRNHPRVRVYFLKPHIHAMIYV